MLVVISLLFKCERRVVKRGTSAIPLSIPTQTVHKLIGRRRCIDVGYHAFINLNCLSFVYKSRKSNFNIKSPHVLLNTTRRS